MRRVGGAAAAVAVIGLLAAGCSSSGSSTAKDEPVISPVSTPAPSSSAAAPTSAPPTTALPSTPASTASSSPSATRARTTAPPIPERSTCTNIGIRVLPGGASMGQEIAALQFTNDGSTSCKLVGYPVVTLLLHGKVIGKPSEPASPAISSRTLAPGEVAESLLHNYVGNCQAPISDSIRVVAPGSQVSMVRPMQLRGCVVRLDKLDAPD